MKEYIERDYWWPRLYKDVARYIAGCDECQRTKIDRTKRQAPLRPHDVPACPFKVVAADFIGPLTESGGFNFICVITCILSKYVIYTACRNTIDSEGFAILFHDNAYAYFGMPRRLITDRGPQFVSKFSKALYKLEGIEGNPSTAYHPQTDGQTKRNNQELETYLRIWCSYHQDDWHKWLRSAQFSYNNKAHSSTGISPFMAVNGQHPYDGYNPRRQVNVPAATERAAQREKTLQEVESALKDAKRRMKEQYDKHVRDHKLYEKGQFVWLDGRNLTTERLTEKLKDLRFGPFKIVKRIGAGAYKIEIPKTWKQKKVHDTFNKRLLKPYVAPFFPLQVLPLPEPPVIINDFVEYVVEKILKSSIRRKKLSFYVKWEGYSNAHNSWEPYNGVLNARELIEEFYKANKCATGVKEWEKLFDEASA
jgi:hypothetical protein